MNGSRRPVALALLLLAAQAACKGMVEPDGPVTFSLLRNCLRVADASERVFRNADEWQRFYSSSAATPGTAPAVDFNRSVVAARFDGTGSACAGYTVQQVEAAGGEIVVRATRHVSADICTPVVAYPQVILTIERRDAPVSFRITQASTPGTNQTGPCL